MKTSNYIVIAFVAFLFGGILLLFISGKYRPGEYDKAELRTIEDKLDDFSVIVATNHADIKVTEGIENNKLTVYYKTSDSIPEMPAFTVQNDTLFIEKTPNKIQAEIRCKKLNEVIITEKSIIRINKLPIDTFAVSVSSGKFYLVADKQTEEVKQIKIHAEDHSYLQFDKMYIEDVELYLNHSTVNFQNTPILSVTGSLKNVSKLRCYRAIGKMNLDIDSNSSYHLSKN